MTIIQKAVVAYFTSKAPPYHLPAGAEESHTKTVTITVPGSRFEPGTSRTLSTVPLQQLVSDNIQALCTWPPNV